MDQLVIDLRFLMVKSSSYRARSVGLGGSSPFRRGKTMTSLSIKVQDACGARAPGFRPLGPIPHRPSLGCPGAAVEPFEGPSFELLVVSVWGQPSGVEPRGAVGPS
jgi:hypothetical protein